MYLCKVLRHKQARDTVNVSLMSSHSDKVLTLHSQQPRILAAPCELDRVRACECLCAGSSDIAIAAVDTFVSTCVYIYIIYIYICACVSVYTFVSVYIIENI